MATKEHPKFSEYRAAARHSRPPRLSGNHSNDSDDPLMLTVEDGAEMSTFGNEAARRRLANVVVPDWLKRIKPLESALDDILLEMAELSRLHGKKLHNLNFSASSDDAVISNQTKKITRQLGEIKEAVKGLGKGSTMTKQETYMKENIQKVLASRLQDIGNKFRRDQLRYQSELEATTNPKKPSSPMSISTGSVDRPVQLDDSDEEDAVATYDIGFTEQQQAQAAVSRIRIDQRMREIAEIAQQVEELGQMFTDIAMMVHEQGSLLDRIDYNIESADHSITEGKKNLEEVVKGEKGFSKRLCFLLLLILIFGIVVIIVVLTKPR